jgi:COP9 signalosome complex subunit 3
MVEAFKKYVLVSLLVQGKHTGLSKQASNVVHRYMKTCCACYIEFANAYATHEMEKVVKVATENQKTFVEDNNFGLVKQCIQALARSNIQRLTQTYLTLSLADIAKAVNLQSPKEAEQYLLKMVTHFDHPLITLFYRLKKEKLMHKLIKKMEWFHLMMN